VLLLKPYTTSFSAIGEFRKRIRCDAAEEYEETAVRWRRQTNSTQEVERKSISNEGNQTQDAYENK